MTEKARREKCKTEAAKLAAEKQSGETWWQKLVNNGKAFVQKLVNDAIEIIDGFAGIISGGANTIGFL